MRKIYVLRLGVLLTIINILFFIVLSKIEGEIPGTLRITFYLLSSVYMGYATATGWMLLFSLKAKLITKIFLSPTYIMLGGVVGFVFFPFWINRTYIQKRPEYQ